MMQAIRDQAKGWIGWVIVIIVIIPFALWGVQEFAQRQATVAVATVNGEEISEGELQDAYLQQRQRLQAMMGEQFRPEWIDEQQLRREALAQMIERRVLTAAQQDAGYQVSDAQIAARIRGFDVFHADGAFSPQRYRSYLAAQGLTPPQFEQQLRGDVLMEQLYTGIAATAFLTPHEVDNALRLRQQRRDIGYATVPADRFVDDVTVSGDEVEAFYEANQEDFATPERVRAAYIELSIDDVAAQIDVREDAVRALYDERAEQGQLGGSERRRTRHILIDAEAGAESVAAATEQVRALRERIQAGEDFAALAREHSADTGSAAQGGDLDFSSRGEMVPAFEEAAFALEVGELSGPVVSEFGVHLIEVLDVEGEPTPDYEAVRDELRQDLQRRRAEMRFRETGERLANLAYEQPDTLEIAAEELDLEVQHSDWITREGAEEGIAQYGRVVQAVFSDDVLGQGYNSAPIEIEAQRVVVARVAEHEPGTPRPLSAVRDEIERTLRNAKARERADELAQRVVARVRGGAAAAEVARDEGLTWERVARVAREDRQDASDGEAAKVPPAVARRAFRMPRPGEDAPSVASAQGAAGDPVVIAVYAVHDGDAESVAEAERQRQREALVSSYGNQLFRSLVDSLEAQAEIRIHEKTLRDAD